MRDAQRLLLWAASSPTLVSPVAPICNCPLPHPPTPQHLRPGPPRAGSTWRPSSPPPPTATARTTTTSARSGPSWASVSPLGPLPCMLLWGATWVEGRCAKQGWKRASPGVCSAAAAAAAAGAADAAAGAAAAPPRQRCAPRPAACACLPACLRRFEESIVHACSLQAELRRVRAEGRRRRQGRALSSPARRAALTRRRRKEHRLYVDPLPAQLRAVREAQPRSQGFGSQGGAGLILPQLPSARREPLDRHLSALFFLLPPLDAAAVPFLTRDRYRNL